MRTRSLWALGISATLLSLSATGVANAQGGGSLGRQIERDVRNSVGNMITGSQPNTYRSPYYGPNNNAPYYGPNQGQVPGYGWPGNSYPGTRPGYYQQPTYYNNNRYQQPSPYVRTQPTYDPQYQPTTYVAPSTPVQRYQIPAEYTGTPAGYAITYGGRTYLTNSDGTMSPYSGPVAR